jgi:hypothetical protein
MPARASHLPNVYERNALQELKIGELPQPRIGTASVVANCWPRAGSNPAALLVLIESLSLERKPSGRRCRSGHLEGSTSESE